MSFGEKPVTMGKLESEGDQCMTKPGVPLATDLLVPRKDPGHV